MRSQSEIVFNEREAMNRRLQPRSVSIVDTTLRDGLQIEDAIVPTAVKIAIGHQLADAGIRKLEVGAFVNPKKVPQMGDSEEVVNGLKHLENSGVELSCLVFNRHGAERAVNCGVKVVNLVISASEGHSKSNADASIGQATDRLMDAVEILNSNGVKFTIGTAVSFFCPFDGVTDPDNLVSVIQPFIEAGAIGYGLADTVGNANPGLVVRNTRVAMEAFPNYPVSLHLHDTYNFGMANVWAALGLGIDKFDATVGGLGGCPFAPGAAGNIGTDDLIHLLHREGILTGIDPKKLVAVRKPLIKAIGHGLSSKLSSIEATPDLPRGGY